MARYRVYDYDSEYYYEPGSFNKDYKTDLSDKVKEIERQSLPKEIVESFLNGEYHTCVTTNQLFLYRVYGLYSNDRLHSEFSDSKGAKLMGAYASTEFAESYTDVKIRLALDPQWFNTKMYEAKILVPTGTLIQVGIVAPVMTRGGVVLQGGAEQILLPRDWKEEWIVGYRKLTLGQLHAEPIYASEKPEEIDDNNSIYRPQCPFCRGEDIMEIPVGYRFFYKGSKGNIYKTVYLCLNPDCQCRW